jgi:hypothetical protein
MGFQMFGIQMFNAMTLMKLSELNRDFLMPIAPDSLIVLEKKYEIKIVVWHAYDINLLMHTQL